jgi:hypothetical protein
MPDQSSQSVLVAAQPAEIMAVIGDFPNYPRWAEALTECEVLSWFADGSAEQVRFTLDAGMLKDTYVLAYTWAGTGLRVDWRLVSSQVQRSHEGSYVLLPVGRQTEVTYALSLELDLPLITVFKRRAEQAIMDTALKSLKQRVESAR